MSSFIGGNSGGDSSVADGSITNVKVSDSADIAGTKINPNFGSQNISTTGVLSIGATPATNGAIRLTYGSEIDFLNLAGNANHRVLKYGRNDANDTDNTLTLGDSNVARMYLTTATYSIRMQGTSGGLVFGVPGTTINITGSEGSNLANFNSVNIATGGGTAASTGAIRLNNNNTIQFRNAANNADVQALQVNTSNQVVVGAASVSVSMPGSILTLGSTVPTTGAIRLPFDQRIYTQVSAGGSDVLLIGCTNLVGYNGAIIIGNTLNPAIRCTVVNGRSLTFDSTATLSLASNGPGNSTINSGLDTNTASATGDSLTISGQNATGTTSTGGNLILKSGTGTTANGIVKIQAGSTDIIGFAGTGGNLSTIGNIRLPSNFTARQRNAANSADLLVIASDGADGIEIGSSNVTKITFTCDSSRTLTWDNGTLSLSNNPVAGAIINSGADTGTASATGEKLTIQAQNATGTTSNGGELVLTSGNGTTAAGEISLATGGTKRFRANATGLAFFNVAPVARAAAYTVTNGLTDRSYDADTVAVAELADVVATIIADLKAYGLFQ
jgi:hypothetical protein